jgi:D-alanyl-D-alanine carboxypeptidase
MPARNMNMKAGQVWTLNDSLHALLIVSANDAAVALAERVSGNLDEFGRLMTETAQRLGMTDSPVLRDPSGLDDEFSVQGGNLISAHDLAIAARAAMANEQIRQIVRTDIYRFHGGDGHGHRLLNHNSLLKTYPGANGVKTGYTRKAGHSLIAEATRDGRTMLTVVLGAPDMYRSSTALLDKGFTIPMAMQRNLPKLPRIVEGPVAAQPAKAVTPVEVRQPSPHSFNVQSDDTARAVRDGLWIAVICIPVGYVGLRLLAGRKRRRYLFR